MFYQASQSNASKYCKEDISNIEGFMKAMRDRDNYYSCHHRLETHTSDGEERLVQLTPDELEALGMYYNRPASELVWLTRSEHNRVHRKYKSIIGRVKSKEERDKISKGITKARKDKYWASNGFKGKKHTEESKTLISERLTGIKRTKEHNAKIAEYHWFNNGIKSIKAKVCPEGYKPGRVVFWH